MYHYVKNIRKSYEDPSDMLNIFKGGIISMPDFIPDKVHLDIYLEIIGACPTCGSPIYGQKHIRKDDTPNIRKTCMCSMAQQKDIKNTMHTK